MSDNIIKCPTCEGILIQNVNDKFFKCENNHSFDVAKQGYINLLISNKNKNMHHGDSKEMMDARKSFLWNEHYEIIATKLSDYVSHLMSNGSVSILDAGSGIGYYLKKIKDSIGDSSSYYGIDISKKGIIEACKVDKTISWIVGSTSKLPFINDSFDIIISVFSPITIGEFERVLKPSGRLLVVSPNEDHLLELKKEVYETILERNYEGNKLASDKLELFNSNDIKNTIIVQKESLKDLLMMTPHYWRVKAEAKEKLYSLNSLEVGIDVVLDEYRFKTQM